MDISIEGPLSKWTNVVIGWQYRWFVLDEGAGVLWYYTVRVVYILILVMGGAVAQSVQSMMLLTYYLETEAVSEGQYKPHTGRIVRTGHAPAVYTMEILSINQHSVFRFTVDTVNI